MLTKPFIIFAAVLVLAGGGFFTYKTVYKPEVVSTNTESTETENNAPAGKKMAFTELLKQGGSYQCTVNQYVENIESKGTVFIDKDRIRGDFTTQTQGMTIQSSMIVKDGYTYTWSSALGNRGMKIRNQTPQGGAQIEGKATPPSAYIGFNGETIGDYDCDSWSVDESKFTAPASITFKELLMQ